MKTDTVLRAGMLAFFHSFGAGLVPCKVLRIYVDPDRGGKLADVVITATRNRGTWKRGEIMREQSARWIVPRGAVFTRGHVYRIAPYRIEVSDNANR